MAETQLALNRSPIISMEQQTSKFGSSTTLGTASFTIPGAAHELHCYSASALHYRNNGTATTGDGSHAVGAGKVFVINHKDQTTVQIIGDGGALTLTIAYMK